MDENKIEVDIIISQGVQSQPAGIQQQQIIINPVKVIRSPYIPSALSLAITFVVIGVDPGKQHNIEMKIEHEKTKKLIFDSGARRTNITNNSDNLIINADLNNLGFEAEGKYLAIIEIDGEPYSNDFYVLKKSH